MNILGFDTVSTSFSIALKKNDKIFEYNKKDIKNHNEILLPILKDFISQNNITLDDIDYIAIGIGPGSFTAIRILFSTIKSICYAKNIKIIGISSLEALYQNIKEYEGIKASVINARSGSIYANIYCDDEKVYENLDITVDEFIEKINNLNNKENKNVILCGDGFEKNKEVFLGKINNIKDINNDNIIKASNTILLSESRYNNKDFDDVFSISPLYIRKSEAENKKELENR